MATHEPIMKAPRAGLFVLVATLFGCGSGDSSGFFTSGGAAGATADAGPDSSGSGGSSGAGSGGTAGSGATSSGGSAGQPGSGGANGSDGATPCRPSALLMIQRSGAMVEPVFATDSWWDSLESVLVGSGAIVEGYAPRVAIGAGTFHTLQGALSCPSVQATPLPANATEIADHLAQAKLDAQAAISAMIKSDSPVGPAVVQATQLLANAPGAKYMVLVLFGNPDGCSGTPDYRECYVDESIAAVQAAYANGVTTIPILLRGPIYDDAIYEWYAQALANAGDGRSVGPLTESLMPSVRCEPQRLQLSADYSGAAGSARRYTVPEQGPIVQVSATDLFAQLDAAFRRISQCN
jgi:hypothetical protein